MLDADKTRMIGLPYSEKSYDDMLSRFHLIPERYGRTDGRTDRQTDRFVISISRVSMLTRDNKYSKNQLMSGGSLNIRNYSLREQQYLLLNFS